MSENFVGEIRLFSQGWAPEGWVNCDGRELPIVSFQKLFALIGCRYGGDGTHTFAVPDLRGRVVTGMGTSDCGTVYHIADRGGSEGVTLQKSQVGPHSHRVQVSAEVDSQPAPGHHYPCVLDGSGSRPRKIYAPYSGTVQPMDERALGPAGNDHPAPHDNLQPSLVQNFCIALDGIFPQQP